ncbi:hypothetical protein ACFE6N_04565 [Pedobacter sp. BG31]|uniref:hypothetical protein n=1 Tax=Pedobacter sp. BG31 TaxID=3349697 RepID=UPI0035F368F1
MPESIKSLKDLQLCEEEMPSSNGVTSFSYVHKPEVQPFILYLILKAQFDEPNDFSFDEDKTQWQYLFRYKDFYIEIGDWKLLSTSIRVYHDQDDRVSAESIARQIEKLILTAVDRHKKAVSSRIKNCDHKLLENSFVTYYQTAENLLEVSKGIDDLILARLGSQHNIFDLWHKRDDLHRSAFLMYLSAFEGFLNITYELYLKNELRTDRLKEKLSRELIDIKLQLLPVYCDGFTISIIDQNDERYKNYLKLVNLRNDFVHAKLNKSLERYIVDEDGYTFIIENEHRGELPNNISHLTHEHVLLAKKYIDDMVDMVIESLNVKTKREFMKVLFEEEIEVEDIGGVLIPI